MPGRPYTALEVNRALELERQGYSHREIAALLGRRSHRMLGVHLSRRHTSPRPPRDGLPAHAAELRRLLDAGASQATCARLLRVGDSTIARWLRRLHLAPPPPPSQKGRTCSERTRQRIGTAKYERERAYCAALGWPECSVPTHARILALLSRRGALTHAEIAAGLGLKLYPRRDQPGGQSTELSKYLVRMRRGLRYVVKVPGPRGLRTPRYAVAPWLLARRADPS